MSTQQQGRSAPSKQQYRPTLPYLTGKSLAKYLASLPTYQCLALWHRTHLPKPKCFAILFFYSSFAFFLHNGKKCPKWPGQWRLHPKWLSVSGPRLSMTGSHNAHPWPAQFLKEISDIREKLPSLNNLQETSKVLWVRPSTGIQSNTC